MRTKGGDERRGEEGKERKRVRKEGGGREKMMKR